MWIDQWGKASFKRRDDGKGENIIILFRQRKVRTLDTREKVTELDRSIEHINFEFDPR